MLSRYNPAGLSYLGRQRYGPFSSGSYRAVGRAGEALGRYARRWLNRRQGVPSSQGPPRSSEGSRKRRRTESHGIQHGTVVNEGTGGQCSYFNGRPGKYYISKAVVDTYPPQVFQNAVALQLLSAVGLQNAVCPISLVNPVDLTGATGNGVSRLFLEKATGDVTLNNIYLSNAYIIIYDIMAREDIHAGPINSPIAAWSAGGVDEGTPNSYQKLGSTPWQTEVFNQFYKVVQVTNVVLAAGGTHVHKIRLRPNHIFSAARAEYSQYTLGRHTYFCMVEVHGSPANDTVTQNEVSVGVGGLNIIADKEHTWKQLSLNTPNITLQSEIPTAFTTAEQVVNMGGSLIQPQAEG